MTSSDDQRLTNEELQTLENILVKLSGPGADLPWPLFRFITEVTATPNVDLLVEDAEKRVLFAWRDDPFGVRTRKCSGRPVRANGCRTHAASSDGRSRNGLSRPGSGWASAAQTYSPVRLMCSHPSGATWRIKSGGTATPRAASASKAACR